MLAEKMRTELLDRVEEVLTELGLFGLSIPVDHLTVVVGKVQTEAVVIVVAANHLDVRHNYRPKQLMTCPRLGHSFD